MPDAIVDGSAVLWILVAVVIEAMVVTLYLSMQGRHAEIPGMLLMLLSGAALIAAVLLALWQASWMKIGACLALSLVAHFGDLLLRLARPDHRGERSGIRTPRQDSNQETTP